LTISGTQTYTGATTISGGTLAFGTFTGGGPVPVPNGGFTIGAPTGGYVENPSGASWTFLNHSGVAANNSDFNVANAPSGFAAFLHNYFGANGSFSQNINFPAPGNYAVTFSAEYRAGFGTGNPFDIQLDGTTIRGLGGLLPASGTSFTTITGVFNVSTAGSVSIAFVGVGTANVDETSFIDNISIVPLGGGALPSTTSLSIAAGATLDLNGVSQHVAGLTGFAGATITNNAIVPATITIAQPLGLSTYNGVIGDGYGQTAVNINGPGALTLGE